MPNKDIQLPATICLVFTHEILFLFGEFLLLLLMYHGGGGGGRWEDPFWADGPSEGVQLIRDRGTSSFWRIVGKWVSWVN